ncbi:2648_t:CDS:2 [Acaulospora morrowiae]|uniref:2648_t:CDS:1 n=1 Tax=Acaulospora morrowiae TaxID=94023 RepID=A0A9N9EI20_9GLOM|nr:2648_t:CDS:2 [Acaulospora morrowiae]
MARHQVLLLMDNCPAHTAGILDIANTEIKFLPPNTTSKLMGLQAEQSKHDILNVINMIVPAWELDVTASTIANCWKHCGLADSQAKCLPSEKICKVQMEEEFFANRSSRNLVANEEESEDNMAEYPYYTSKQVHEALEIMQGYAIQKDDDNGKGHKAINAYQKYFSRKLIQTQYQAWLPDMFTRQFTN